MMNSLQAFDNNWSQPFDNSWYFEGDRELMKTSINSGNVPHSGNVPGGVIFSPYPEYYDAIAKTEKTAIQYVQEIIKGLEYKLDIKKKELIALELDLQSRKEELKKLQS